MFFKVKGKVVPVSKHQAMEMYGGLEAQSSAFLTAIPGGSEWSALCCGCFTPIETVPQYSQAWLSPRTSLKMVAKRNLNAPAGTQAPII